MMLSTFFRDNKAIVTTLALFQVFVIVLSNYLITYPITVLGQVFTLGAFVFPLAILSADITLRLLGKDATKKLIAIAYLPAIILSSWAIWLHGLPFADAMRIGLASGFAYLISLILTALAFDYINGFKNIVRPIAALSVVAVTFIDTYLFFYISFANTNNPYLSTMWSEIAFNQSLVKIAVSWILFIPLYGFVMSRIKMVNHSNER